MNQEKIDKVAEQAKKLHFDRLYFKRSKNNKNEECYIGKVKLYVDDATDPSGKRYEGDAIVIGNMFGAQKCNITEEGRWTVKVKPMAKGRGYVVVEAEWAFDQIEIKREGYSIRFLINGREERLCTDDGKHIPLFFKCDNYYSPEMILPSIKRKMEYLQLPPDFCKQDIYDKYMEMCEGVLKEYDKQAKKKAPKEAELEVEVELNLSDLKNRFNGK